MSDIKINNITDRTGDSGPIFAGISTVSTSAFMVMPSGPTEFRGGRGRAVISGGFGPSIQSSMDKFEIATTGNATSFGDMAGNNAQGAMVASSTRGVFGGYSTPGASSAMYYHIFSSDGAVNDFGELGLQNYEKQGQGNNIRGLFTGGSVGPTNKNKDIRFITIASTGNATFFGSLTAGGGQAGRGNANSPTRAVVALNENNINTLDFITIATSGNAEQFGSLRSYRNGEPCLTSNSIRGIAAGGYDGSTTTDDITFITIATKGDGTDFGNLSNKGNQLAGASSSTRAVFCGNLAPAGGIGNVMEFVTIASTGNATDFGDLTVKRAQSGGCNSDVHGGLG